MPRKIKYVIYPGNVRSIHDGEIHYIGYQTLIKLYGIHPKYCVRADGRTPVPIDSIDLSPRLRGDYIHHLERLEKEEEI